MSISHDQTLSTDARRNPRISIFAYCSRSLLLR